MGGGKERKQSAAMQNQIAQSQLQTSQDYLGLAKQEQERRTALQQPSIDFYTKLTGNDPNARMTAVAPALGDIARAGRSGKEAIYDSAPRGAARDFALSQVPQQQAAQGAEFLNKAFMGAFPAMASLGTESGQVGLQQTGAGMRGAEAASQTNQSVMQNQQAQKASQLGMIGSLAGMGGSLAMGGGLGKLGGGAASKAGSAVSGFNNGPQSAFPWQLFGSR